MASLCAYLPSSRSVLLASVAVFSLASHANAFDSAAPDGAGYTVAIPQPAVTYPLPIAENYRNQTGKNAKGESVSAYDDKDNPIIDILSGFKHIWTLGDEDWANGGANGDGPADFSKVRILDAGIWAENMRYVLSVTGKNRTQAAAFDAYLNDRRSQGYSVIEGMGPLAAWYREGAGATTTINHTLEDFNVNEVVAKKEDDKGTEAGSPDSELKNFVAFMKMMRGPEGTTSPAKYFYSTPRPWRMNAEGEVIQTGTETVGDKTFERYETAPDVIVPALSYVRDDRGRQKDGGFPSGHTNAAYLAAIAYAYAVPERFAELLTNASALGESRIVAGMHSPLDVIGGRITATAMAAAMLQDQRFAEPKKAAYEELQAYFKKRLPEGQSLQSFAHSEDLASDRFANETDNKSDYRKRMTYSFSRDTLKANAPMIVPQGAEVLLETRLPYLSAEQRRAVLFSTGIESGYPLLDDSNGWGRINLVAAASGYGSLNGDVNISMDASAGGFNAQDQWSNDISGNGRLSKSGSGTLILTGHNNFSGGIIVTDGTLAAGSNTALGTGNVLVSGGMLKVETREGLILNGNYSQTGGALSVGARTGPVKVAGEAKIENATLHVTFDGEVPKAGSKIDIIAANAVTGTFTSIEAEGANVRPVYTGNSVALIVE